MRNQRHILILDAKDVLLLVIALARHENSLDGEPYRKNVSYMKVGMHESKHTLVNSRYFDRALTDHKSHASGQHIKRSIHQPRPTA